MSRREAVARWLYEETMAWVAEMYEAQGLGITPWDECPLSIQEAWMDKADEVIALVEGQS